MRVLARTFRYTLAVAFALFLAIPHFLSAQRATVDSVRSDLRRYCKTSKAVGYLCPVDTLRLKRVSDALSAPAPVPPQPTPTPTDSTQPAPPRVYLDTRLEASPAAGATVRVAGGSDLQAALDMAKCGDRVLLPAGVTFVGNYRLAKACPVGAWVLVMTEGCSTVPAEGVRATPQAAACFAKLVSPSSLPPLTVAPGASRYRLIGVDVTVDPSQRVSNTLIELGDGAATSNAQLPRNIIVDRSYVHGLDSTDVHRCIAINGDSLAVIDSYVANCHMRGIDAQAIWGWNGNGPFKITNNYLEASSEVFGFGGADPGIPNLVPSDIEFRRNHVTRPMSWKGGPWLIKNLIEFKNARMALIDGNVLENSWPNGQQGWAFVLWSVNQQGRCTWCVTRDVTVTNNLIRNVAAGFQLNEQYPPAVPMNHIAIRNNVLVGVDNATITGGGYGFLMQGVLPFLTIEHNTAFVPSVSSLQWTISTPLPNLVVRNNLVGGGSYPLFASPTQSWAAVAGQGSAFAGNVIALGAYFGTNFPAGNFYPATLDAIGLTGGAAAAYALVDPLQLVLSASSAYKGKATDGKDPGADVASVLAATKGVVVP